MLELRILNGLHRGATLPLDERPLVIGASDDADVVLVDPGIETEHATLTLTAQGWSLSTLDGAVLNADHNRLLTSLDLQVGDFARLGQIWLTVADSESRWENPPPEPAQSDADDDAGDAESADEQPGLETDIDVEEDELYRDSPLDAPQNAEKEAVAAVVQPAAEEAKPAVAKAASRFGWRRSKTVLLPLALVTILSACAAYTMTARSHGDSAPKTPDARNASSPASPQPDTTAAEAPHVQAPKPSLQISQQELRDTFRQRLKEVDLLKRFNLNLKDNAWTMQASLDDEEAARFERILTAFINTHNIKFPVHAKVGSAEAMLPFRIREVISGSNASVVTEDGNRLYIGDEYQGMRLAAIDGHQLRFEGERKIKVKW